MAVAARNELAKALIDLAMEESSPTPEASKAKAEQAQFKLRDLKLPQFVNKPPSIDLAYETYKQQLKAMRANNANSEQIAKFMHDFYHSRKHQEDPVE